MKFYEYKTCSTCIKAAKFLAAKKVNFERIPIVDQPPTITELKKMLLFVGDIKNLFNTSGQLYRELNISEKVKNGLSDSEALELLAKNGKLIKRPFLLSDKFGVVGFKEETWQKLF